MKLRSIERMMSRCFKEFPFGGFRMTQYIPELGVIYKESGRLRRVSYCEEVYKDCMIVKIVQL